MITPPANKTVNKERMMEFESLLKETKELLKNQDVFVKENIVDHIVLSGEIEIRGERAEIVGRDFINRLLNRTPLVSMTPKLSGGLEVSFSCNDLAKEGSKNSKVITPYPYYQDLKDIVEYFTSTTSSPPSINLDFDDDNFRLTIKDHYIRDTFGGLHNILRISDKISVSLDGKANNVDDEVFVILELEIPKNYKELKEYRKIRYDIKEFPNGVVVGVG